VAKLNLNRVSMPKQSPATRAKNFDEVAQGYTSQQALEEASRCIQCPKRNCVAGCPVGVEIPEFIQALRDGDLPQAVRALKSTNSLPGICGRVCPQETQCEDTCSLAKRDAPVAIGRLERYVADWELAHGSPVEAVSSPPTGKAVAIVGSGPAGLTAAAELAKRGVQIAERYCPGGG
jgi:glutamate synthase (NADPH/NADH) small chain